MQKVIELLIESNLLNSESTFLYLVIGFFILAFLIIGLAKKAISLIITGAICLVLFGSLFMVKVSVVDNNGIQFQNNGIVTSSGDYIEYTDIGNVMIRDNNKIVLVSDEDGEEVILKVDSSHAKALQGAIETVLEKAKEESKK